MDFNGMPVGSDSPSLSDIAAVTKGDDKFLYLLLFFAFGGIGGNKNDNATAQQADSNLSTLLRAADNNGAAINQVCSQMSMNASEVRQGINSINQQFGGIQAAFERINTTMVSSCCDTRAAIDKCCCQLGLQICNGVNTLSSDIKDNRFANQLGFSQLGDKIDNGTKELGFQVERQTQALSSQATANTQRIIDSQNDARMEAYRATIDTQAREISECRAKDLIDQQNSKIDSLTALVECCCCNSRTPSSK